METAIHLTSLAAHWLALNAHGPVNPTTSPTGVPAPKTGGSGYGFGAVLGAGVAGLGAGAGALWYGLRQRLARSDSSADLARPSAGDQAAAAWDRGARNRAWNEAAAQPPSADRDRLVSALIDLADRLRDDRAGLWKTANRHLEAVGVRVHVADGERFDPGVHEAGGYQPTERPDRHLTVASTEECGYADGGRVLRRPRVIVYRVPGDGRVR